MGLKRLSFAFMASFLILLMIVCSSVRSSFSNAQNSTEPVLVLGQNNFNSTALRLSDNSLTIPQSIVFDSHGNIWIVDSGGARVVKYAPPFSTGEAASLVIGQKTFNSSRCLVPTTNQSNLCAPFGIAFDVKGNLWISDSGHSRILEFKAPFVNGENASIVIGHSDFTSSNPIAALPSSLTPLGIAFDSSGNLWAADAGSHRVLEFEPPFSNGENASLVLGQPNFHTTNSLSVTRSSLNSPVSLAFDGDGNIWVTDQENKRVVRFDYPFSDDENASIVLGAANFTSIPTFRINSTTLFLSPFGIAFDPQGNLLVTDTGTNQIMSFSPPFSNGEAGTVFLGQENFKSSSKTNAIQGFKSPSSISFDSSGNPWVADSQNNRVLEFSSGIVNSSTMTSSSASSLSDSYVVIPLLILVLSMTCLFVVTRIRKEKV